MTYEELLKSFLGNREIEREFRRYKKMYRDACRDMDIKTPSAESLQLAISRLCQSLQGIASFVYVLENKGMIECKDEIAFLQDLYTLFEVLQAGYSIQKLNPKVHEHNAEIFNLMQSSKQSKGLPLDTMEIVE